MLIWPLWYVDVTEPDSWQTVCFLHWTPAPSLQLFRTSGMYKAVCLCLWLPVALHGCLCLSLAGLNKFHITALSPGTIVREDQDCLWAWIARIVWFRTRASTLAQCVRKNRRPWIWKPLSIPKIIQQTIVMHWTIYFSKLSALWTEQTKTEQNKIFELFKTCLCLRELNYVNRITMG